MARTLLSAAVVLVVVAVALAVAVALVVAVALAVALAVVLVVALCSPMKPRQSQVLAKIVSASCPRAEIM